MLYLIGLGLDYNSISKKSLEIIGKCKKIYLENYTVEFPYPIKKLEEVTKKKIFPADREFIESLNIVDEAKKTDVALLIYGSPLTATTHISLIQESMKKKVKYKIIYNASILDAVAETGLQLYKFGKISSIPKWSESFKPKSFIENLKQNLSIDAHSLILIDIGLKFKDALDELTESADYYKLKLNKIIVCSNLGTDKSEIIYGKIDDLTDKNIKAPFCLIVPGKLHFVEEEVLEYHSKKI
ncbi:MAG: diphthine synthase [Candidatus Nanoarchaeia archaeon]